MLSMTALSTKYRTLTNPATAETNPNTAIVDYRIPGNNQKTYSSFTIAGDVVVQRGYGHGDCARIIYLLRVCRYR